MKVEPYTDPYDNYVFPEAEIKAEVEQAENPEKNVANIRAHLGPLWQEAWAESSIEKYKQNYRKKRQWLNSLWYSAEDAYQTGSQVYGRFYLKDSSDKDVIVKVSRRALGSKLLSLIGEEQAKYYRKGTCRVKIGDVDFIITTEQKIFDNWVNITDFLKHNPPPNKSETVKMFDMMEAGENYESYYRGQHRWFQHLEYLLGQFAEIGSHYCEVLGLYKMGYGTYCVLRHGPPDKFSVHGATISNLRDYFGEKLEAGQPYAIVPITEIKKFVPKVTTKIKEEKMNEESYSMDAPSEKRTYKDALKTSGHKMKDHIKHGMAVGAATEGASYAYQQVAHVLKTQFGVSDEALNDPLKRELITFAALAVTHMGATVFDEVPGMDKVTKGCELALEGKAKDNTGALIQHLLPMLLNVSKAMDPSTHMQRIAAEAEKQRVALDNAEQDAHIEAAALEEDHNEPAKARQG